jgi:hypothetical protein
LETKQDDDSGKEYPEISIDSCFVNSILLLDCTGRKIDKKVARSENAFRRIFDKK